MIFYAFLRKIGGERDHGLVEKPTFTLFFFTKFRSALGHMTWTRLFPSFESHSLFPTFMSAPPVLIAALLKGLRNETEETEDAVRCPHSLPSPLYPSTYSLYRAREAVEVCCSVGRWIPQYLGPFIDIRDILCAGIPSDEPSVVPFRFYLAC